MKKFAKVIAIIALICAVLGVVLAGIGAVGGGTRLVKKMAAEGLLNVGPGEEGWYERLEDLEFRVEVGDNIEFNDNYEIFSVGEHNFDASVDEVDNLVLNIAAGDVNIKTGISEQWKVSVDGFGKLQLYVEDGTLYIVGSQSGIVGYVADVEISVPKGEWLDSVQFDMGAGDLDAKQLNANTVSIAAGAADIEIEETNAEVVELSVGAGNVEVASGQIIDLEVAVGMGAADIDATIKGNVRGSVSMGELVLCVRGSEKGAHNYDVSCAAGEVCIGSTSYAGVGNHQEIDNGADTTYTLDCAMGSIDVNFK